MAIMLFLLRLTLLTQEIEHQGTSTFSLSPGDIPRGQEPSVLRRHCRWSRGQMPGPLPSPSHPQGWDGSAGAGLGRSEEPPHRVRKAGTTRLGRAGYPLAVELGQASPSRRPLCQGETQPPGGPGRWPELAQLGGGKDGLFGGKAGECEPWSLVWPGPSRSMRRMC